jgi:hypothetical protein
MNNKLLLCLPLAFALAACSGGSPGAPSGGSGAPNSDTGNAATAASSGRIIDNQDLTPGLQGVDADRNGIRDDIDRLIAKKYSGTPEIKRAVEQDAKALQRFLEVTDKDQARLAEEGISRASACVFKVFPDSTAQESELRDQWVKEVEALTANTRERFTKYWRSNALVGGMAFSQPQEPVCD